MQRVPQASLGIVGGSTTWGARFPEGFDLGLPVVKYLGEFSTPFGMSAPFKLIEYKDAVILYVGMHGCFPNESEMIHPYFASKQLAWVFKQAGVSAILGGGSVGGIQTSAGERLPRWSVVIPNDFVMTPNIVLVPQGRIPLDNHNSPFYRMARPFDSALSRVL